MAPPLVLLAHPHPAHSRVNRAYAAAATRAGLAVRDLYALYPDYAIDVATERRLLAEAGLLVWLHPLHWYGMPPLLKLWLDEVFGFGWAYGPGGRALAGKHLWLVVSTGGSAHAYTPEGHNRHHFDAFLPAYRQTAALTGMAWLPPLVLHGAHQVDEATLAAEAEAFARRLAAWPQWPELAAAEAACTSCDVPADARPAGDDTAPAAPSLSAV